MIELMFPQTVSNILDYDGIKAAAKKYVEDVFVQITESFGNNLVLQSMDEAHLSEVSKHVTGNSELSLEELLSYMNTENIYRECDFVSELTDAFPDGVEYLEFEVTGWGFPSADFAPFNGPDRSYAFDGTPALGASDNAWAFNALEGNYVNNLLLSRYKGQLLAPAQEPNWHKKSGRRSSWGNTETWMTTGGFGKPGTIHINVDEERSVIEENGLTAVENWLGTVANKLPINLYIEINSNFTTNAKPASSGFAGYHMAFPYEEEEGFCTNDPDWPKEAYNWLESVKTFPIGGSMGVNYSESVTGYFPKRMKRGFILFTGELRENIIQQGGIITNGGINFTGKLRVNIIPQSGIVEKWTNI